MQILVYPPRLGVTAVISQLLYEYKDVSTLVVTAVPQALNSLLKVYLPLPSIVSYADTVRISEALNGNTTHFRYAATNSYKYVIIIDSLEQLMTTGLFNDARNADAQILVVVLTSVDTPAVSYSYLGKVATPFTVSSTARQAIQALPPVRLVAEPVDGIVMDKTLGKHLLFDDRPALVTSADNPLNILSLNADIQMGQIERFNTQGPQFSWSIAMDRAPIIPITSLSHIHFAKIPDIWTYWALLAKTWTVDSYPPVQALEPTVQTVASPRSPRMLRAIWSPEVCTVDVAQSPRQASPTGLRANHSSRQQCADGISELTIHFYVDDTNSAEYEQLRVDIEASQDSFAELVQTLSRR